MVTPRGEPQTHERSCEATKYDFVRVLQIEFSFSTWPRRTPLTVGEVSCSEFLRLCCRSLSELSLDLELSEGRVRISHSFTLDKDLITFKYVKFVYLVNISSWEVLSHSFSPDCLCDYLAKSDLFLSCCNQQKLHANICTTSSIWNWKSDIIWQLLGTFGASTSYFHWKIVSKTRRLCNTFPRIGTLI